ncbi:MAG: L-rhamnose mutarotase [Actinomycetota bacterium]|nr:L-rhamnose mutarotase [Actinomycetota bacterium]
MNRTCFTLRVRPDRLDEYRKHHEDVWPQMQEALTRSGWRNYSLFLTDEGLLIGYVETPGTFDEALAAMADEPVNTEWQAMMAPFFEGDGTAADQMMRTVDEVFHLP